MDKMINIPGLAEAFNSSAIISALDHAGHITYANSNLTLLSGISAEALYGTAFFDLSTGYYSEYFINELWESLRNNRVWRGEIVNKSKNGHLYWLEGRIVPSIGQDGTSQIYLVIAFDVTERKLVEQALAEREQFIKTLMVQAPIGIFQTDTNRRILYCNEYYAHLVSSTPSTLLHTDWISAVHKADLSTVQFDWNKFIAKESPFSTVFRIQQEGKFWVECIATSLRDETNNTVGYVATVQDISRRRQLEQELLQTQKLESVGQLAAGIAHEINTPIQFIGDNTRFLQDEVSNILTLLDSSMKLIELLKNGDSPLEILHEIDRLAEQVDAPYLIKEIPVAIQQSLDGITRVARLVQAMKEFSHPGTNEKQIIDINKTIESTVIVSTNEWKYVATVETNFDHALPLVPCHPGELNQVILNLIVNAAHAIAEVKDRGPTGKGRIIISTHNLGDRVEIRIQDNGGGIPKDIAQKVFDPFFTTKAVGKGTGQGLAIARTIIVNKHGGTIGFESDAGMGTTFILCLQIKDSVLVNSSQAVSIS